MGDDKEKRWNEDLMVHETNHNAWLNDYELYVLEEALMIRIFQVTGTRDKCGIDPNDRFHDVNQNIQAMRSIAEKFGITLSV